jgi:hypothetical protein
MSDPQINPLDDNVPAYDYHVEETAQYTQAAIDAKNRWGMISIEDNLKGLIVGMLSKLEEKYQVKS